MGRLSFIVGVLLLLVVWLSSMVVILDVFGRTGPNCPGLDPAWLGRCDAQEALK